MDMKNTAAGAGRSALILLKVLVLGFWFGGGVLVSTAVSRIIRDHFVNDAPQGAALASSIEFWFSTVAIIAAAVLAVLLFLFQRSRRAWWTLVAVLAVVGVINAYGVAAWMKNASTEGARATLGAVHEWVFCAEVALAFFLLAAVAFARKEGRAAEEKPVEPAPEAPQPLPSITPLQDQPGAGETGIEPSPFRSPERDVIPPPEEPRVEDRGPEARPPEGEGDRS